MKFIYEIHCYSKATDKESIYPTAYVNANTAMKQTEKLRAYSGFSRVWIEPIELNED